MPKIHPTFKARNYKTHIVYEDTRTVSTYLKTLPDEIQVTLKPFSTRSSRSNSQNAYYFGVVLALCAEEIGCSTENCHEEFKRMFLADRIVIEGKRGDKKGVITDFGITPTTTQLTTVEFEDYLKDIREWARDFLNCNIPLPNQVEVG